MTSSRERAGNPRDADQDARLVRALTVSSRSPSRAQPERVRCRPAAWRSIASSRPGRADPAWTSPCESTSASACSTSAGRHAGIAHGRLQQPRDADAGGTGAGQQDALRAERLPEQTQPGQDAGQHDGGRALDVVVEARHAVAIAVQDAERVVLLEVLPLDEAARPDLLDAGDEGIDQRVVLGASQPWLSVADVQRVGQQLGVIGPDVQADRQGQARVDAARRRCTARACRSGWPCRPRPRSPRPRMRSLSVTTMSRTSVYGPLRRISGIRSRSCGVIQAPRVRRRTWLNSWQAQPDRGRVDDRQQLLEVLGQDPIEEGRVAVLQRRQADVLLQRVVLAPQALELERDLLLDRHHPVRAAGRAGRTRRARRR